MTGGMVPGDIPSFAGSERLRPDGRPKPELRAELRRIDDTRNAITSVIVVALPIALLALVASIGHWAAIVAAVPVMGSLQLRFYILHHEAAHRLLFSNRRVNDVIGINLFGWVVFGTGQHNYRRAHSNHHRDEFGPKEPDFLLYSFYPIGRASMARKLRRDATGISAWRIMKPRFTGLLKRQYIPTSLRFFGMQALLFGAFWLAGIPWLFLWLWVVPYVTWYQFVNRLRSIAEHGGMTRSNDRRATTHLVQQTPLARATFAPYNVGFHLAHHVDSGVPFRNLPRLREILIEDGYADDAIMWPGYPALWRSLIARP